MTWERQRAYDYDDGKEAGIIQGRQETAIEAAITLIKKYNASPETAAVDMDVPLDCVLKALESCEA